MASSWRIALLLLAVLGAATGCSQTLNEPLNPSVAAVAEFSPDYIPEAEDGSTVIGLAFSGGGTRAAAFAYGILRELDETPVPGGRSLAESIRMISGVSGGAVTAAYFGLKGTPGFRDLRERFLIRDVEASMHTSAYWPPNLFRLLAGGVNDRSTFANWLDENLFDGARYASLKHPGAPILWINASDIYNETPFLFTYDTFASLCSDLNQVPISEAVAGSAAFPIVFAPVVIKTYGPHCGYKRPDWLVRRRSRTIRTSTG
jgi:predicted acylesterase/phospholipase RssA